MIWKGDSTRKDWPVPKPRCGNVSEEEKRGKLDRLGSGRVFQSVPRPPRAQVATFTGGWGPNLQGPCNTVWPGDLIGLGLSVPISQLAKQTREGSPPSGDHRARTEGELPTPDGASKSVSIPPLPSWAKNRLALTGGSWQACGPHPPGLGASGEATSRYLCTTFPWEAGEGQPTVFLSF